ncbi:MAG TPA: NAD(P)-dependent oxidoreductase [Thermoanaerobaculia bacterium]|nr:NAD(P)-dependent oxidoreductase [Thermoanaerobaculia bacterium]
MTGAAGQLGASIVRELLARGAHVTGTDRVPAPPSLSSIPWVERDLASESGNGLAWPDVDTVIHSAGSKRDHPFRAGEAVELLYANVVSTAAALGCSRSVRRLVLISSISVYGATVGEIDESMSGYPVSSYGLSKWLAELVAALWVGADACRELVIIRLSQVYGPMTSPDNAMYRLIGQALESGRLDLLCPATLLRDYIHVEDAARAIVEGALGCPPGTYNVGAGRGLSMGEIAAAITETSGAVLGRFAGDEAAKDRYLSTALFLRATGFVPRIKLRDGIAREVSRLRSEQR